jgi:diguanylate cyclase (GGDEF)-like protein
MEHESGRLRRSGLTALILIADIDLFKNVNDRWGHEAGDVALVKLAEVLRDCTRNSDVISRWGGEEFVIFCPQINELHASVICNRIRHHLQRNSIQVPGAEPFHLTLSIGAAMFAPSLHDEPWEAALARADQALYQVKNNGRDGWALAASTQPCKPEPATT